MIDSSFQVTHPRPGVAVVTLQGEHDISCRDQYRAMFGELLDEHELVVVDVSEARFIDSSFIHTLFISSREAREVGKSFRLQTGTAPVVQRVLELSGALDAIEVAHSREEAGGLSAKRQCGSEVGRPSQNRHGLSTHTHARTALRSKVNGSNRDPRPLRLTASSRPGSL